MTVAHPISPDIGARLDRLPLTRLFPDVTADRLRMAIGRACRDAGVPHFAPHALRHRRISLLHRQGVGGDGGGPRDRDLPADGRAERSGARRAQRRLARRMTTVAGRITFV